MRALLGVSMMHIKQCTLGDVLHQTHIRCVAMDILRQAFRASGFVLCVARGCFLFFYSV